MIRIYSYVETDTLRDDEPVYLIFDPDTNRLHNTCKDYQKAKEILKDWESIGYQTELNKI